ncbi:hypothetical protein HLB27_15330 [Dickeya dadantii]|uniref:hypothetical protein n=1 Tax=Dickeya dadantii TaxID=204038 RepID=UPI001495C2A9|nr:hypothetical protein [Dickeya dadantii]NPE59801.1 hypothetical protein [Dickeya dadantii]NPE71850.1 hypothetical protein [Dickeya dadantii]
MTVAINVTVEINVAVAINVIAAINMLTENKVIAALITHSTNNRFRKKASLAFIPLELKHRQLYFSIYLPNEDS